MSYQTHISQAFRWQQIQSRAYGKNFRTLALVFFTLFFCFQVSKTTASLVQDQNCEATIDHISIAQAVSHNANQRLNSGWLKVDRLPDSPDQHWASYQGNVWYQIQFNYHCNKPQQEPLNLSISHINMAGKIYINDDLLWTDQSLVEPLSRSWNTPRHWVLPASALKKSANTLWIYVAKSPTQPAQLGSLHLGTAAQVIPYYQDDQFSQRTLIVIGLIMNITVGIFYLMVWLIYRKESTYLWIFLAIVFWVAYSFLFLAHQMPFSSANLDRLIGWFFSTYSIISCISIWRFAHRRFPKIETGLLILFVLFTLILLITPEIYLVAVLSCIFVINMTIFLLQNITYPFIAYQSKQIEVYFMALIHFIFVPISIHDAHQVLNSNTEYWSPYATPLTALVLGIVLGLRVYRNKKMIESFQQTLTEKINQVTEELKTSLNEQHELALQNTRLQERIHLSHDLHDGLGGSLVRSMALVDKSEHIDKDQFMSILKLLRNDLRQVIDQGSSAGQKLPETPTLWVSTLRRRFVQIFEELDIQSEWQIPKAWHKTLTQLESLTLTRVTEEALTNIIKHSKANQVYIRLIQHEKHLVLEIEDNGIGFDPNTVQTGLHIGLNSMQLRVNRLGGKFEVHSEAGKTLIRVQL